MVTIKDLERMVSNYYMNKQDLDSYTELCDEENKEIKKVMGELKLDIHEFGDYKVTRTVSKRETINEDVLLDIVRSHSIPVIKTKEYVDMDALESLIYNNQVPNDVLLQMDKARNCKEVVTLKVTKKKNRGK